MVISLSVGQYRRGVLQWSFALKSYTYVYDETFLSTKRWAGESFQILPFRFQSLPFAYIPFHSPVKLHENWPSMTLSYRTESANMYKLENWSSNTSLHWMHHDCEIFAQLCKKTFTRVKKEWTSSVEVCEKLASRQKPGWSYEWVENEPNPFVPKFPRARQWTLKVRIVL